MQWLNKALQKNKLISFFDAAVLCAPVSDEGLGDIKGSYLGFLLYDNLGQLQYFALHWNPASAQGLQKGLFWAVMKLMGNCIGAGHVCGVAAL